MPGGDRTSALGAQREHWRREEETWQVAKALGDSKEELLQAIDT